MDLETVSFSKYLRRYGVELEVNSTDGICKRSTEGPPTGIDYVASIVSEVLADSVEVMRWGHTNHNSNWVVKSDASCGIEICSSVSKGKLGLDDICRVVDALAADPIVDADQRCSFHVHVEVADLSPEEIARILGWWFKCEWVFFMSVPSCRKRNRYCQFLGQSDVVEHNTVFTPTQLIQKVSVYKYFSINTFHLAKNRKPTVEFRIAENEACMDSEFVTNWVMLLVHFVEQAKSRPLLPYKQGDQWTSFLWLEPREVFEFLGFLGPVDEGMAAVRSWMLRRMVSNGFGDLPGIWSSEVVGVAMGKVVELAGELKIDIEPFFPA